jgi:hypothetical protein
VLIWGLVAWKPNPIYLVLRLDIHAPKITTAGGLEIAVGTRRLVIWAYGSLRDGLDRLKLVLAFPVCSLVGNRVTLSSAVWSGVSQVLRGMTGR